MRVTPTDEQAMKTRLKRAVAAVLMGTMLFGGGAGGCYGKFPLTKAVYKINGSITNNKIIHSIIFWIFIILPVYNLAMLVDAIVLNLIEFWTGASLDVSSVELDDGTRITLAPSEDQNTAILTVEHTDGSVQTTQFERVSQTQLNVVDEHGTVVGYVYRTEDGGIRLCDARGDTVQMLAAADLKALSAATAIQY